MSIIDVDSTDQIIQVESTTQVIVVNPETQAVSIVNGGPPGPRGFRGPGGNWNEWNKPAGDYTLVLDDESKTTLFPFTGGPYTLFIPHHDDVEFDVGVMFPVIAGGTGLSIGPAGPGITLYSTSNRALQPIEQVWLHQYALNEWLISDSPPFALTSALDDEIDDREDADAVLETAISDEEAARIAADSAHVGAADPHTQYQLASEKGSADGYAPLDLTSHLDDAYIPSTITRDSELAAAVAAGLATILGGLPPGTLDTIAEIAAAFNNDPDALNNLITLVATKVAKADYNANTVLVANTDDTPLAVEIPEDRLFGRLASGNIGPLTDAQVRSLLALVIGTNVQAYDADLSAFAGLTSAADKLPYATGAQAWALTTLTAFARTLLDDLDSTAARATLGLGTMAVEAASTYATQAGVDAAAAIIAANFATIAAIPFVTTTADGNLSNEVAIGSILNYGTHALRPAANTLPAGAIFFETDTLDVFRGDGAGNNWVAVITLGTMAAETASNYATTSATSTLSNKRIVPRVSTEASSATPTINTDNVDAHSITALAAAISSMTTNLTGTPNNFDKLIIRIKDNGTARAITWGASFEAKGMALPTTTVISKVLTVGFIWDSVSSKWGCVASSQEA